jgi:hypothetical protein
MGSMQANAPLTQHRCKKQGVIVEAAEKDTIHSAASRGHADLGLPRRFDTGKLWLQGRHMSSLLPFRLSGCDQNNLEDIRDIE